MTVIQDMVRPATAAEIDEQEHQWRAAVEGRLAAFDFRPNGRYERAAKAEFRDLGDLLITNWVCPELDGRRSSKMVSREADALMLVTASVGTQVVETSHQTVVLHPGDVLILSSRLTGRIIVPERICKRTVRIPLTAILPFDAGHGVPECLLLTAAGNPLASLAHDYLTGVCHTIDLMSPVEVEGARTALLALTAGMIRASQAADVGETDFLPLLRKKLESWIVDHLTSGAIQVRDLAAAHHVASRTVHRAFARTGDTVGSVVRAHRLAAARTDLVTTTSSIAAIAHRWGFCDASHLGREFRREYSMSPSDYREAYAVA